MTKVVKNALCGGGSLFALACLARSAAADDGPSLALLSGAAVVASRDGAGLALDGRLRLPSGLQLGMAFAGRALRVAYLGGRTAEGIVDGEATALGLVPLLQSEPAEFGLRFASGLRYLRDSAALETPYRDALRLTTELAVLTHVRIGTHGMLRAGALLGVELEVQPTAELADQLQLITLGLGWKIGPSILVYSSVDAGGTYGFDGDNGKAVLRGALGLRLALGGDVRTAF